MLSLALILLVAPTLASAQPTCGPVPSTSICASILAPNYSAAPVNPTTGAEDVACPLDVEDFTAPSLVPLIVGQTHNTTLKLELARFLCASYYPPCGTPTMKPCRSSCENIVGIVGPVITAGPDAATPEGRDALLVQSLGLWTTLFNSGNCNGYSADTTVCNSGNFSPAITSAAAIPAAKCEKYTGSACAGVVDNVYVPAGQTQAAIEANLAAATGIYRLTPFGTNCTKDMAKFLCSKAFWPCYTTTATFAGATRPFQYPQLTLRSVCDSYSSSCASFITTFQQKEPARSALLVPNCTLSRTPILERRKCDGTVLNGLLTFPEVSSTFPPSITVPGQDFTSATVQNLPADWTVSPTITCPAPLVIPDNPRTSKRISGSHCAMPCPSFMFSSDEYVTQSKAYLGVSVVSFVCAWFLLLTFTTFAEKRKSTYVVSFMAMLVVISTAIFIGALATYPQQKKNGIPEALCENNTDEMEMPTGGWCVVQAVSVVGGMISLAAWWCVSAADLFIKIVVGWRPSVSSRQHTILRWAYNIWGWAIPALLTIIALSLNSLGAVDLSGCYCFIHSRSNSFPFAPWLVVYYPIMIYIFVGGGSMIATLVTLSRSSRNSNSQSCKHYSGPIIFVLVFLVVFGSLIAYRATAYFREAPWRESATEFVTCLLMEKPFNPSKVCGDGHGHPSERPNVPFWNYIHFIVSATGLIAMTIYGTTGDIYKLWAARMGWLFNIDYCKRYGENTTEAARQRRKRGDTSVSKGNRPASSRGRGKSNANVMSTGDNPVSNSTLASPVSGDGVSSPGCSGENGGGISNSGSFAVRPVKSNLFAKQSGRLLGSRSGGLGSGSVGSSSNLSPSGATGRAGGPSLHSSSPVVSSNSFMSSTLGVSSEGRDHGFSTVSTASSHQPHSNRHLSPSSSASGSPEGLELASGSGSNGTNSSYGRDSGNSDDGAGTLPPPPLPPSHPVTKHSFKPLPPPLPPSSSNTPSTTPSSSASTGSDASSSAPASPSCAVALQLPPTFGYGAGGPPASRPSRPLPPVPPPTHLAFPPPLPPQAQAGANTSAPLAPAAVVPPTPPPFDPSRLGPMGGGSGPVPPSAPSAKNDDDEELPPPPPPPV